MEKTFERAMNGELFQVKCDGILLFLLAPNTIEETEEANVKHMKQHDVVLARAPNTLNASKKLEMIPEENISPINMKNIIIPPIACTTFSTSLLPFLFIFDLQDQAK
jgi:hypothetical protein